MQRLLLAVCSALLVACSSVSHKRESATVTGNIPSAAHQKKMASDVATKLTALYPPARSKLTLKRAPADAFGISLLNALRREGYAISESDALSTKAAAARPANAGEFNLSYVVDQPLDTGLTRITVFLNAQSLTRLYEVNERGVAPAGYWIRKE